MTIALDWVDLFWFGAFILLGLIILAWEKGWLGLLTEKRIKTKLAAIKHEEQVWLQELWKKTGIPIPAATDTVITIPGTVSKEDLDRAKKEWESKRGVPTWNETFKPLPPTKEQRLDEVGALLASGKISVQEHEAARTAIIND